MADFFDPFGKPSSRHAAMRSESLRNRQSIGRGWLFNGTHIPQSDCAVFFECGSIERLYLFLLVDHIRCPLYQLPA
jgi:hypothetical protein